MLRGFTIADEVASLVVINDRDSAPAWSSKLLHELVHLMVGQTGISGANPGTEVERLGSNVAAKWLMTERSDVRHLSMMLLTTSSFIPRSRTGRRCACKRLSHLGMHLARLTRFGPVDKFFLRRVSVQHQLLSQSMEDLPHVTGLATVEA